MQRSTLSAVSSLPYMLYIHGCLPAVYTYSILYTYSIYATDVQLQIVPETLTTCTWHATHCVSIVHTHHTSNSNSNSTSNSNSNSNSNNSDVAPPITTPNSEALCNECLVIAMQGT
jgi:hypothetical protein